MTHFRREAGHCRNEGAVLSQMGRGYRLQRQSTVALSYLEQALNISKETGDRGLEAHVFYHMGLVYIDTEHYERAQELLEQALYFCKEVEDRQREGRTTNSLGKVYAALGKSEQAKAYYQQALFIAREVEDQWCEGTALQNLGMYFFKRNNYAPAAACFLLAEQRLEEVQSPDAQEAQASLRELHDTIGEKLYGALLVEVEPQAQLIVDQALNWELAKEEK